MVDWTRISIRNLVYQLRHSEDEVTETEAYHLLVKTLNSYLYNIVSQKGWYGIADQQEVIIHNTILRLLYPNTPFRGNSWQYRGYVRRTLFTVCTRFIKKLGDWDSMDESLHGREEQTLLDLITDDGAHDLSGTSDSFVVIAPEELLTGYEEDEVLQTAVSQLSTRDQQLLQLADVEKHPYEDVAKQVGLSKGNVKTSLSRARSRYLYEIVNQLAERDLALPTAQVVDAIQQLPDEQQTLLQAWWGGETSWNKLGRLLSPTRSQAETKELFAQGLAKLFYLLQTYEVNR